MCKVVSSRTLCLCRPTFSGPSSIHSLGDDSLLLVSGQSIKLHIAPPLPSYVCTLHGPAHPGVVGVMTMTDQPAAPPSPPPKPTPAHHPAPPLVPLFSTPLEETTPCRAPSTR